MRFNAWSTVTLSCFREYGVILSNCRQVFYVVSGYPTETFLLNIINQLNSNQQSIPMNWVVSVAYVSSDVLADPLCINATSSGDWMCSCRITQIIRNSDEWAKNMQCWHVLDICVGLSYLEKRLMEYLSSLLIPNYSQQAHFKFQA